MANYEVNTTTAAWPDTLVNNMTENTLGGEKTLLPIVSAEEIKSEDSIKPKEEKDKVEVGRSVRWPGKHLGDNAGSWIGISSPFPADPLVNQRILSPPSGAPTSYYYPPASDISTPSDVSTTEILDLSSLTSFETPTPPFSSPVFPPRLPVSSSHKVSSTLHSIGACEVPLTNINPRWEIRFRTPQLG